MKLCCVTENFMDIVVHEIELVLTTPYLHAIIAAIKSLNGLH